MSQLKIRARDTWAQLKMAAHVSILVHHVSTAGQTFLGVVKVIGGHGCAVPSKD